MQRSCTELIDEVQRRLSERCIAFEPCEGTDSEFCKSEAFFENLALADDELFEKHSAKRIVDADIAAAISERRIFSLFFRFGTENGRCFRLYRLPFALFPRARV